MSATRSPTGRKKKPAYLNVGINRLAATGGISVLATIQGLAKKKFADMEDVQPFDAHDGCSALWVAAYKGHLEVVQFLLNDPRVNVAFTESTFGWTVLHAAATQGRILVMEILIASKKIKVDAKDKEGRTALILAAEWGRVGALQLLLLAGSGKSLKDNMERDALGVAEYRRKPVEAIGLLAVWPDNREDVQAKYAETKDAARKAHVTHNKVHMAIMDDRRSKNKHAFLDRRRMPINFIRTKEPPAPFMVAARRAREDAVREREAEEMRSRLAQRSRMSTPPSSRDSSRPTSRNSSRPTSRGSERPGSGPGLAAYKKVQK